MQAHTHIYQRLKTGCYLQIDPLNLRATKNMQPCFIVMRILNTALTFLRSRMWTFLDDSYSVPRNMRQAVMLPEMEDEGWMEIELVLGQLQLSIMAIWTGTAESTLKRNLCRQYLLATVMRHYSHVECFGAKIFGWTLLGTSRRTKSSVFLNIVQTAFDPPPPPSF